MRLQRVKFWCWRKWRRITGKPVRILSLGAGVQSSTLALMIAAGELQPVDAAIFADTGAEPLAVYRWLDELTANVPFPVFRVSAGNLAEAIMDNSGARFASIPAFIASKNGGMGRRQCTNEYKLRPIQRKARELMGLKPRQLSKRPAEMVIGISMDEALRMTISKVKYLRNVYPLIDAGIDRRGCVEWLKAHGFKEPPKSACTFCPYHNEAMWRDMKLNDPTSFAQAVAIDGALRNKARFRHQQFLHRSLTPLASVDFRNAADFGQVDAFNNECEGMCGV